MEPLDSVNDAIQTFVRPTAGGIVVGSGTAAQTSAVADPDIASVGMVFLAILVPVLVLVAVVALVWAVVRIVRRRRQRKAARPGPQRSLGPHQR